MVHCIHSHQLCIVSNEHRLENIFHRKVQNVGDKQKYPEREREREREREGEGERERERKRESILNYLIIYKINSQYLHILYQMYIQLLLCTCIIMYNVYIHT